MANSVRSVLVLNNAIIVVPFVWGTYVLESLSGFTANLDSPLCLSRISGQCTAVNVSGYKHPREENLLFLLYLMY